MLKNLIKTTNRTLYPKYLAHGPEWIVLGVNNICNLHCKMCDVGVNYNESNFFQNLMGAKPLNMPLELIKRVIDQTHAYYPKAKLGYAFTEPLIYPDLEASLRYASEKGLFTSITTNALTLKHKADILVSAGLNEINISLDGPPDIHNEIRGHKRSFQRAIEGIEQLLSHTDAPAISVYCVITEWNIGYLKEFISLFMSYPLVRLGFMHTNFTTPEVVERHNALFGHSYPATLSNMEEIHLERMDLERMWEEIAAIRQEVYPFQVIFSPEIESREKLDQFYHQPEVLIGKSCHDIFENIMVKSDGTIIPAHGRCYNLTIGNVYESSLKDIWNSSVISKFRSDVMAEGGLLPGCSRCCSAFSA